MSNYKKQLVREFADRVIAAGFRVFLAERETYGFITDETGSRILCFQNDFLHISLSGNYAKGNKDIGSGWRYDAEYHPDNVNFSNVRDWLYGTAPQWATKGQKVEYATLDSHLARYGSSSRYTELKGV